MVGFDTLPNEVETLKREQSQIKNMLAELLGQKRIEEAPLTSKQLMEMLQISEPTLIRLRKQKKIPFLTIAGTFRYDYQAVLAALNNPKK